MKKRIITFLSLIMAFVLCFSLAACGGNKSSGKKTAQTGKAVTVSVNEAIDAVESVINAKGFTGTASYTLSTKNTEAVTDSVSLDKRGNKMKITSSESETIVDYKTGYVYYKYDTGYVFENEFYANTYDYAQYLFAAIKDRSVDHKFDARYNSKTKTVTFTAEKADSINKYLEPLQNAYKKEKSVGALLNDYCQLLFGKNFDDMYTEFEGYVSDPTHTGDTLLNDLKVAGLDVEALLKAMGYSVPDEIMSAFKARPLNKLIGGAYKYISENMGALFPKDGKNGGSEADAGISSSSSEGMVALGKGLINAMLSDDVSATDIATGMQGLQGLVATLKTFGVDTLVNELNNEDTADLYTVITKDVKIKNATTTLTLTVDGNKAIKGVKLDCLLTHNYNGEAAEDSFLADNDYRATAELVINEYKTTVEDFDITFDRDCDYKTSLVAYVYEVSDKNVSVYLETGGKTVNVSSYVLEWETPDGDSREIQPEDANAFRFDSATSSFVFDSGLIQSAFSKEALAQYVNAGYPTFGTMLTAYVHFDGDDTTGYGITLVYVNDDWQAIAENVSDKAADYIFAFIGGAGSSRPPEDSGIEAA